MFFHDKKKKRNCKIEMLISSKGRPRNSEEAQDSDSENNERMCVYTKARTSERVPIEKGAVAVMGWWDGSG